MCRVMLKQRISKLLKFLNASVSTPFSFCSSSSLILCTPLEGKKIANLKQAIFSVCGQLRIIKSCCWTVNPCMMLSPLSKSLCVVRHQADVLSYATGSQDPGHRHFHQQQCYHKLLLSSSMLLASGSCSSPCKYSSMSQISLFLSCICSLNSFTMWPYKWLSWQSTAARAGVGSGARFVPMPAPLLAQHWSHCTAVCCPELRGGMVETLTTWTVPWVSHCELLCHRHVGDHWQECSLGLG